MSEAPNISIDHASCTILYVVEIDVYCSLNDGLFLNWNVAPLFNVIA